MNKAKLKTYAPQARKDFIAAVTVRANLLGLSEKAGKLEVAASQPQGDATMIAGQAWPVKVHSQREKLITRIQKHGFAQTMDAMAYTWFNRFAALRYMELHNYLGHGHRALSSLEGTLPDILAHAADLAKGGNGGLPGLKPAQVVEMKLAGNRDGELYRILLVAQCNALSNIMPFLFERIDDETELLLPDNLLRSDSVIAKLVASIEEEDWKEVEIIGWLYQLYISEKKSEVIGKVVKSEDIPAATQLFTPKWIVQYLVQNSIGRLWLMANPSSTLKAQWPFYIAASNETLQVQSQLNGLIQARMDEDGGSLNPETITILDPACGSGHILVEAYDVLKAIYLERGYQPRSIPRLILEKNLFGLDIDDRAAQMAAFALLMKARADDRRLFTVTDDVVNLSEIKLNVLSLKESTGLSADELAMHLAPFKVPRATIATLLDTFEHAKTFGSLIQIPYELKAHLTVLLQMLALVKQSGNLYASAAADDLQLLVRQANVLAFRFDAVVANPPYMGSKFQCPRLKNFARENFSDAKSDLFASFLERGYTLAKASGYVAMVTMQSWMFLSSLQKMRERLLREKTIHTMAHLGAGAFGSISGDVLQASAFILQNCPIPEVNPIFFRLVDGVEEDKRTLLLKNDRQFYTMPQDEFEKIPGSPIAYWVSDALRQVFARGTPMGELLDAKEGLGTRDDARFLRHWPEVSQVSIGFNCVSRVDAKNSRKRWFPCNKGGASRKWSGNQEHVVNWEDDGKEITSFRDEFGILKSRPQNQSFYFKPSLSWSSISSESATFRMYDAGSINNDQSMSAFEAGRVDFGAVIAFCNTSITQVTAHLINPTLKFGVGDFEKIPYIEEVDHRIIAQVSLNARRLISISAADWDAYERSWSFQSLPILTACTQPPATLESSYSAWTTNNCDAIDEMKRLEEQNNRLFINAYSLADEIRYEVPIERITLTVNPAYRYGGKLNKEERWARFRNDSMEELVSFVLGCMMGRYSLDEPGLIYANAGNVGFDISRYTTFHADADGIVPLTDELWFEDDAASRIPEFLVAVWGAGTLTENMVWLAESLGTKANETPDEAIRRYLADKFYKDHLQTYKKRPIYWLFSSGKQGAFQALVYLHRYHEGTLARMRAEYVVPLTGKIQSRIEMLELDAIAASSTAARNKLAKEVEKLKKKHVELLAYDEQLRHYADMRITLDLDDGVKVNYGKFGDLLVEVKSVTGGAGDD